MIWREGQGWQIEKVSQVIGKSTEKISKCFGGRTKSGRSRQFCGSLASQRRRLANVLAGGPRLADPQVIGKSKVKLVNVLTGGPRVADQDSFASHWRVKGEDWHMF